jgi:hypothetical protein
VLERPTLRSQISNSALLEGAEGHQVNDYDNFVGTHKVMPTALPPGITLFQDDDRGFFDWLADSPDRYFINTERKPKLSYLVLHRPNCRHFTGNPALHRTKDYVKYCSSCREDLETWTADTLGSDPTPCPTCMG